MNRSPERVESRSSWGSVGIVDPSSDVDVLARAKFGRQTEAELRPGDRWVESKHGVRKASLRALEREKIMVAKGKHLPHSDTESIFDKTLFPIEFRQR